MPSESGYSLKSRTMAVALCRDGDNAYQLDRATYVNHKKTRNAHDPFLPAADVPPSSPPATLLLAYRNRTQIIATATNTITVKPRAAAGTKYSPVSFSLFIHFS